MRSAAGTAAVSSSRRIRWGFWPILGVVAAACALLALGLICGFLVGEWRGHLVAEKQVVARAGSLRRLPDEGQAALESALASLRAGRAAEALRTLKELQNTYPSASSISYLAAVAALQSEQYPVAEKMAKDSIKARQRVSDSLAILAVIAGRGAGRRDSRQEEDLLRAAVTADQANPVVQVELGRFLRDQGRVDEARSAFRAALLRMEPVDSRAVAEITLALLDAESGSLRPEEHGEMSQSARLWAEALTRLQKGEFSGAAESLRAIRAQSDPDVFGYVMGDPVFRSYRNRPELAQFLK